MLLNEKFAHLWYIFGNSGLGLILFGFSFRNIMELRKSYKDDFLKKHGIKLGFMSAFIKASSYALQHQPVVNAVIDDKEIVYRDYVDISVAVATPKVCSFVIYSLLHSFEMHHTFSCKSLREGTLTFSL